MFPLTKDSFEGGFYPFTGINELMCPSGWAPDWVRGTNVGEDVRPEYKPKHKTPEVRPGDGEWSVSIHSREATHCCVLLKQFGVEPGKLHTAQVWAMGVTGPKGKSGHGMRIGIDPTGKCDFRGESVAWSGWYSQYMPVWEDRKWHELAVTTEARNQTITVFLWSSNDYARDAFAHFDDFALFVEGDGGSGDTPPIGDLSEVLRLLGVTIVMVQENKTALAVLQETLSGVPKRGDKITL